MTQSARVSVVPRAGRFERPRSRLLGMLAEAADVSLVVLVAPSGYGKTTLLAQYARSTSRRVAWCRVSGAHEGPGDVVDRLAGQLPELDDLRNLDDRIPDEVLARRLADGLASLEQSIDLIVDNVEDERLTRWLGSLADRLEEGHRLLLSSHSTDGLRLAHRLAESSVLVLGTGDLRFDPAETQAYLEARGESLSAEQLGSLAGWPAGLALSAHGGHRHAEIDDLVLEALQALPPELLAGLPPLALLEFWSEADATVLSPDLPDHWLKTLLRAGLPITPLGGGVFQPHQLLVRVLERLLLQRPDRARASRATAARLLEASGALERAAQLYRQAGETGNAVRLAERLVPRYRDRGEHRLTRALLEPLEAAPLPPALQERLAWAQLETGSSREGELRLQALRDAGLLTPAGFASLATVRGRQGRFEEQLALAQEGLTRVGTGVPVPALSWPLVFASIRLGLFRDAEETAARFVALAEQGDDQVRLAEAWQLQGAAWRYSRPAAEARMPLVRARAVYEGLGWYGRAADLQLDELELSIRNGEVDGAAARLRALESVVVAERAVHHARRLRLLGAAERRTGQLAEAEAALQLALEATRTGGLNLDQSGLPLEWADCLLQQRRPDEAAPWLQMGVPAGLGGRRAVLESLRTGAPLELSLVTVEEEQDAETRLRVLLLLAAQGAPGALSAARLELARSRHTPYLREDRALAAALAGTKAAALLSAPAEPPTAGEGLSLNLKIQTLGDFQAHLNGQAVQVGLAKARELLIWLAVHGSGSRDELVTALWDGSAEERHVEYFRVAVRRLRGALKPFMPVNLDPLPYADTRYRLAPELHLEIDVLAPVSPAWTRPFLPGIDTDWVQQYRTQTLEQAVTLLSDQARRAAPDQAVHRYRQLLSADPLLALAHEGLIRSLIDTGERAEAKQALRTYARMLEAEFQADVPAAFMNSLPTALIG